MSGSSFNLSNSFRKYENNDEDVKNENNIISDDANSEKRNKNDLFFNNSEESQNSLESITSHFSKNSNVKNLFDV